MKIQDNILDIISNAIIETDKIILTGQLNRKDYVDTNTVLELCGYKWNTKAKAHLAKSSDARDVIDLALTTGEILNPVKDFDYFPTPKNVVDQLIEYANISTGMRILEPSAGTGNIAKEISTIENITIDVCEINQHMIQILNQQNYNVVHEGDFLEFNPETKYDRIIANPPFSKNKDIDHVNHMIDLINDKGMVISVMSGGIKSNSDKKTTALREKIKSSGEIITLPEGSFKSSGTGVNSVIIIYSK